MLRLSRLLTGLTVASALLTALTAWDRWAGGPGASPLEWFGGLLSPRRHWDPRHEADFHADVVERCRRLQEVADEVRAGRLGLLDGAARLRDIQSTSPYFAWQQFREFYPGDSDDERFCHLLIRLVTPLPAPPDHTDPVVARLNAELAEHLKRGPIRLP